MDNIFDKQRRTIYFELKQFGLEEQECHAEADIILEHVTQLTRAQQIISNLDHFKSGWLQEITRILNSRRERKPLAYCLSEVEFAGLKFRIVPGVLIPRPDTETLVQAIVDRIRQSGDQRTVGADANPPVRSDVSVESLRLLEATVSDEAVGVKFQRPQGIWVMPSGLPLSPKHNMSPFEATSSEETESADKQKNKFHRPIHIADIGVGCGAIAIALLKRLPQCTVWACDISEPAIHCALGNARRHNVHDRLTLVHGDWKKVLPNDFDIIVSNPPYLPLSAQRDLQAEITFEPKSALFDGSEDGLSFYRQFAEKLPAHFAVTTNTASHLGFGFSGTRTASLRCHASAEPSPLRETGDQHTVGAGIDTRPFSPFAAFEIGDKQEQAVLEIFKQNGWQNLSITRDINSLPRVLIASHVGRQL